MSEIVKTDTRELVLPSALPMQPARTVAEVYRTMFVRPLETLQELATFYYNMDSVRGGDKVEKIQRDLLRDHSISYFKGFFMGHSGVGKSTEINRLVRRVGEKFRIIRFSAQSDLNATDFRPFDILFVILYKLMEAIRQLGKGDQIPVELLDQIYAWFHTTEYTQLYETMEQREEKKEAGTPQKLTQIIGLLFNVKNAWLSLRSRLPCRRPCGENFKFYKEPKNSGSPSSWRSVPK